MTQGAMDEMHVVTLQDARARVELLPVLGAAVARYDATTDHGPVALLRPWGGAPNPHPFELGSNLLLPWSNRISGGGFTFDGRFHALKPNWEGEPLPIHGNGFAESWDVASVSSRAAQFTLVSHGPGSFHYFAAITYSLSDGALEMDLEVEHLGDTPLPYGIGFHPWFIRSADTRLQASAQDIWLVDDNQLPTEKIPVSEIPEWDFNKLSPLPSGFIDNGFAGWDGRAVIAWRDRGVEVDIAASPNLDRYLVYAPSADAGFFCFEPISHPVDAHNLPGGPEAHGLTVLSRGERLTGTMTIAWRAAAIPT